jgi:hypothetical protein
MDVSLLLEVSRANRILNTDYSEHRGTCAALTVSFTFQLMGEIAMTAVELTLSIFLLQHRLLPILKRCKVWLPDVLWLRLRRFLVRGCIPSITAASQHVRLLRIQVLIVYYREGERSSPRKSQGITRHHTAAAAITGTYIN